MAEAFGAYELGPLERAQEPSEVCAFVAVELRHLVCVASEGRWLFWPKACALAMGLLVHQASDRCLRTIQASVRRSYILSAL